MKALRNARSAGFTLVEVMVALLVLGVLVSLGMPSFLEMLRNMEIRAAAESVANGLQRARAEAVARNTRVQFVLGTGTSWTVDYVAKPVPTDPPIDSRPSSDSANATMLPEASDTTAATIVTYNQLGQLLPVNPDGSKPIALINFAAASGTQGLRILIGAGGNARVCDPSLVPPNIRAC
jgi:type IV fimbrial biogenesis protein FimT